jgi:hypothetical protein
VVERNSNDDLDTVQVDWRDRGAVGSKWRGDFSKTPNTYEGRSKSRVGLTTKVVALIDALAQPSPLRSFSQASVATASVLNRLAFAGRCAKLLQNKRRFVREAPSV